MKTPKVFTDNLKKGIITDVMISECLYSVNKRAKNYRDQERHYRNSRYDYYGNEESNRDKKESYYKLKEKMLAILVPDCIHEEEYRKKIRYYDYEPEYDEKLKENIVHEGEYYDRDMKEYTQFIDVMETGKRYYLFYDLPGHSFHTPIEEYNLTKYSNLNILSIDSLITEGHDIDDLISMQFVKKLVALIESEKYKYIISKKS